MEISPNRNIRISHQEIQHCLHMVFLTKQALMNQANVKVFNCFVIFLFAAELKNIRITVNIEFRGQHYLVIHAGQIQPVINVIPAGHAINLTVDLSVNMSNFILK